jgi:hypothetical protein
LPETQQATLKHAQKTFLTTPLNQQLPTLKHQPTDQIQPTIRKEALKSHFTQKQQAKTMINMSTSSPPLLPPPRAIDKDDYECSNCGFSSICHKSKIWEDEKINEKRKMFYSYE